MTKTFLENSDGIRLSLVEVTEDKSLVINEKSGRSAWVHTHHLVKRGFKLLAPIVLKRNIYQMP